MLSEYAQQKIGKFQTELTAWAARTATNPVAKKMLYDFFASTDVKLSKTKEELRFIEFSILRLKRYDRYVFRIVSHEELGRPGAFGRVKLAFSLSVFADRIEIKQHIPIALKIIRHREANAPLATIPSRYALQFILEESYGSDESQDIFGFAIRPTDSIKSRYDKHKDHFSPVELSTRRPAEMSSLEKKYLSMPFFDGEPLAKLLHDRSLLSPEAQLFSEDKILKIVLGLIRELLTLHNASYAHLDVHPENIILDINYHLNLIDPDCISAFRNWTTLRTADGYRLGKTGQQVQADRNFDIYAFGKILVQLCNYCPGGALSDHLLGWARNIERTKGSLPKDLREIQKKLPPQYQSIKLPDPPALWPESILQIPFL